MNDTFLVPEEAGKRKVVFFQKLTLVAICIYALSMYVGYISAALLTVQSLSLYAIAGFMLVAILQCGSIRFNQYQIWYGVFILASLISCLYSADRTRSVSSVYGLVVVWIFAMALNTVITGRVHIEMIFASLVVGSALLTVSLIVTGQFKA